MKAPNRTPAVMQQRLRDDVPDPLNYFPTPPWATRALCEFLGLYLTPTLDDQHVWEPACGELHMARPLGEYFASVTATDVWRYHPDHGICDFLLDGPVFCQPDWIVTNPPFKVGAAFIEKAVRRARRGVAMFVRSSFTESDGRYDALFAPDTRPAWVLTFSERVGLFKGRLIEVGKPDPFNLDEDGTPRKASTATSYSWLIWQLGQHDNPPPLDRPRHPPPAGTRRRLPQLRPSLPRTRRHVAVIVLHFLLRCAGRIGAALSRAINQPWPCPYNEPGCTFSNCDRCIGDSAW